MFQRILHSALFLVGLLGTAFLIRSADALPFWSWARGKMGSLQAALDSYDTVVFGSSRVDYGFVPEEFDARMKELGFASMSFNGAVAGTRLHDFIVVIDWVLEQRPKNLKRVIVELHSCDVRSEGLNWMSDQILEMHDPAELPSRLRSTILSNANLGEKWAEAYSHIIHSVTNGLRIGQGTRILSDLCTRLRGDPLLPHMVKRHGYQCVEDIDEPYLRRRHKEFVEDPKAADWVVAEKISDIAPPRLRGGFDHATLRALSARLQAAGVEPIYVVMPSFSAGFYGRDGVAEVARDHIVLELDKPLEHPALLPRELWYDSTHMSRSGAIFFSRYLADQMVARKPRSLSPAPPAAVPVAPTPSRPTLSGMRTFAAPQRVEFTASNLPERGDVLLLVGTAAATQEFGRGLVLQVALPVSWWGLMARTGSGAATVVVDLPGLAKDQVLHAQLCVLENGVVTGGSVGVQVEPPR